MPVSARRMERRERPGQAWAINYLGVCVEGVAGSEGAGRERQESEKKKYGDAAPAQGASERASGRGEEQERVSVCQSAWARHHHGEQGPACLHVPWERQVCVCLGWGLS